MEGGILPSRKESCRLGAKDEGKDRTGEGKGKGALCRSQGGFGKSLSRISAESISIGKSIGKKTETWGKKASNWFHRHNPFENEDEYEEMLQAAHCRNTMYEMNGM